MRWSKDYYIDQVDTGEGHLYVVKDKTGKTILKVPGITSRINEYFESYQNDFPASGLNYLKQFSIKDIEQMLRKPVTPIPGSRLRFSTGSALRYKTGMTESQLNSYIIQRRAIEEGTTIHEELQDAIQTGVQPRHPKARQMWNSFVRAYPPQDYSYEAEVPVTDLKKWGTSIDVIVTNKKTGAVGIFDWKTGHEHAPQHTAQLTKEAQMYEFVTGKKVSQLGVVYPTHLQKTAPMNNKEISKIFDIRGSTFRKYATKSIAPDQPYKIQLAQDYLDQLGIPRLPARRNPRQYSDEIVFLDTETGHANEILQVGAVKGRINYHTGKFEYLDVFERYYYPTMTNTADYQEAYGIHKIDTMTQRRYRKLQNASYSGSYDDSERQALLDFIGESVVSGHAILQSDLPWLKLDKIKNNIYDTYEAAKYVYKNEASYGLEKLYNKHIGRRKEYHQAFIDALMNAQLGGKMSLKSRRIQYVLNNPGFAIYPPEISLEGTDIDPLIGRSGVRTTRMGEDIKDYWKGGNMGADDMEDDVLDPLENKYGRGVDFIDDIPRDDRPSGQWDELFKAMSEAVTHMDSYAKTVGGMTQNLSDSIAGYNLTTNRRMMQGIVHKYAEEDWDIALKEELGISSGNIASWHSRLAGIKDREERGERVKAEDNVRRAVDKGLISQSQADIIQKAAQSVDDLNDGLAAQIKNNEQIRKSLKDIRFYDLNQMHATLENEWAGIKKASQGVMPEWFRKPLASFGDAFMNVINKKMAAYRAVKNTWDNVASPVLEGVGSFVGGVATKGNPGGMMLGAAIGRASAAGISQIIGSTATGRIAQVGERIQEVFNIYKGLLDIVMTPVRLLGNIIKTVVRLFGALAGAIAVGIKSMQNLATPLTHLTGVHFPMQQGLEAAGYMTGLGKDTFGKVYNDWANQSQALYTTGQVNRDRLVAASMLGVFGDVYNPTADADEMYGGAVNHILSQLRGADPTRRKQIMGLAGRVDSSLPQTLQVMSDLELKDWKQLRTYSGYAYFRPHSDSERTLYRRQSFQFQGNLESMMNSVRRIASKLWTVFEPVVSALNKTLDLVATTFQKMDFKKPGEALKWLKNQLFGQWDSLKAKLDFNPLISFAKKIVPTVIDIVAEIAKAMIRLWSKVIHTVIEKGDMLLAYLSSIKVDWKAIKKGDFENAFSIGTGKDKRSAIYNDWWGNLRFYNSKGEEYLPHGAVLDQTTGQYYNTKQFLINAVMKNKDIGGHIGGRGLMFTPRNEEEAEWLVDAIVGDKRLGEKGFLGEVKYLRKGALLGGDTGALDAWYRAHSDFSGSAKFLNVIDSIERTGINAIDATKVALMQGANNVLDINIGVNGKPMWSVEAGSDGVQLTSNNVDRRAIEGYEINATYRYLQQAGQKRAAGGN